VEGGAWRYTLGDTSSNKTDTVPTSGMKVRRQKISIKTRKK
jgi:hypothetical protein